MRVWKNWSQNAFCCVCGKQVAIGEPCVKVDTVYAYKWSRSVYMHKRCIKEAIALLQQFDKELEVKYLVWKVGGENGSQ